MSLWKSLTARFAAGAGGLIDVGCDEAGHLICLDHNAYNAYKGAAFFLRMYRGEVADGITVQVLWSIGSNKDLHFAVLEGLFEGYWEMELFEDPVVAAAGMAITPICSNRFIAGTSDATFTAMPTLVNTTVDAASAIGQKVLNVTVTAGFESGKWVKLDAGEQGVDNNEFCLIDTIQAGVSLTMVDNLQNNYTNETVESTGFRIMHTHAEGGVKKDMTAGGAISGGELIVKADGLYMMRMVNRSGAAARSSNQLWWFEVDKQT